MTIDYTTVATKVFQYRFATDSEQGSIMARDFIEAKQMLRDKIDDTDGGEGWVELSAPLIGVLVLGEADLTAADLLTALAAQK